MKDYKWLKYTAFCCVLVGFVILILFTWKLGELGFAITNSFSTKDLELNSYIGEFIGGITGSLWALAGIILFYLAIKLQSQELQETREQFKDQQFDNSFFNLLRTQHEIRNSLEYQGKYYEDVYSKEISTKSVSTLTTLYNNLEWIHKSLEQVSYQDQVYPNRSYFNNIYDINFEYEIDKDDWPDINDANPKEKAIKAYNYLFGKQINLLGHYFRHLYNILEFVENYAAKQEEPKKKEILDKYSQFIQAQLSNAELALLFYNGLKYKNMYEKICQFKLIENLAREDLIEESHTEFYPVQIKSKYDPY